MYIILCIIVILIVLTICIYNTMLSKRNKMLKAYSSLDVMLKKRYDLIPNIVESVKAYKEYEEKTLERIISLRKREDECKDTKKMQDLDSEYNEFMNDINLLSESYPELKASDNFMHLQKILNEVEEQISAARRTYNAHVESYNSYINFIPINLFASIFNFKKYNFFEITNEERNKKIDIGELTK